MFYELDLIIEEVDCELDCVIEEKIDLGNTTVKPLMVTENGEYIGGEENGKRVAYSPVNVNIQPKISPLTVTENGVYEASEIDGYNPVTVDIPLPVEPITITENGTYEAENGKGFTPITVDIKQDKAGVIKELVDIKGSAANLFVRLSGAGVFITNEILSEFLRYDTTENAISLGYMFQGQSQLTEIPLMNTKKVQTFIYAFSNCTGLTTLPEFDTENVTSFQATFSACSGLTSIPLYNTKKVTTVVNAFANCIKLKVIPHWDLRSCTNYSAFVGNCTTLEEIWIKNIKASIQVGSGTNYGHLLKQECLIHLIKELRDTGSAKTLTVGSANLAKLENIYCRLVDITDEMREQDDLIDEKLPFEVCESTDEGAMSLIYEYVYLKNWNIA